MNAIPEFQPWPKVPRLFRDCIITEKIDGTNASVHITEHGHIFAGSRTRWITPADDNHGWAAFVEANHSTFLQMGAGTHYGEWWGNGIQRGYGLSQGDKRFSLFNVTRWRDACPDGLHVVPILYEGPFTTDAVGDVIRNLTEHGSVASPGFMRPEGVITYHIAANAMYKTTIERDAEWKGKQ